MIDVGLEPSNQSELQLGQKGDMWMQGAREWVHDHPEDFERFKRIAIYESKGMKPSPTIVRELTRTGHDVYGDGLRKDPRLCVSIRNEIGPSLARIAMEQGVPFNVKRSCSDGFTEAVL